MWRRCMSADGGHLQRPTVTDRRSEISSGDKAPARALDNHIPVWEYVCVIYEIIGNLSVPLRRDTFAYSSSFGAGAFMRLSFPNDLAGAPGRDLQTPRLSARTWIGNRPAAWEMDDLSLAQSGPR